MRWARPHRTGSGLDAGKLIVLCGRLQWARGDRHSWAHSYAALLAGNTEECGEDCALHDSTPSQIEALTVGRTGPPAGQHLDPVQQPLDPGAGAV